MCAFIFAGLRRFYRCHGSMPGSAASAFLTVQTATRQHVVSTLVMLLLHQHGPNNMHHLPKPEAKKRINNSKECLFCPFCFARFHRAVGHPISTAAFLNEALRFGAWTSGLPRTFQGLPMSQTLRFCKAMAVVMASCAGLQFIHEEADGKRCKCNHRCASKVKWHFGQ